MSEGNGTSSLRSCDAFDIMKNDFVELILQEFAHYAHLDICPNTLVIYVPPNCLHHYHHKSL